MRRADRLFQIIQILRRSRRAVTAEAIAGELETSRRTVYRDIADLVAQRVPICGEAGVGYVLESGFDLPPLMLTQDEVEAAVLGAQFVMRRADPALARAAQDLLAKIGAMAPERLRPFVFEPASGMPPSRLQTIDKLDMQRVRAAIHGGRKMALVYADEDGRQTRRTIWPIAVGYHDLARLLIAWCEMRLAFRRFRTDRVIAAEFLGERYPERPAILRARWRKELAREIAAAGPHTERGEMADGAPEVRSQSEAAPRTTPEGWRAQLGR